MEKAQEMEPPMGCSKLECKIFLDQQTHGDGKNQHHMCKERIEDDNPSTVSSTSNLNARYVGKGRTEPFSTMPT
jgi:hypothetical protein